MPNPYSMKKEAISQLVDNEPSFIKGFGAMLVVGATCAVIAMNGLSWPIYVACALIALYLT